MSKKTVTPEPETQKQEEGETVSGIAGQADTSAKEPSKKEAEAHEPRPILGMREG